MSQSVQLLRDLVALPSVNPMGRDLDGPEIFEHRVTAYLEAFFRDLGVPFERQGVRPFRENIVARCEVPGARRTLLFEAHQDTVPTDGMTIDPFAATIHGGRLHGRGACDVKGGMAAMLAAFARLVRDRPAGAANVVMACTVDEEHTFLGIQRLAPGIQVDRAVVAEPTSLRIVHTHKGAARWHLETQGRACHSSSPEQGINAIYRMGRLVAALEDYAARLPATKSDPYLGPPTLSVGRIEGGTSVNTVPDRCRIEIDRRLIPGEDAASALVDLTAFLRSAVGVDVAFSCSDPWICLPPLPSQGGPAKQQLIADLGRLLDETLGRHEIIAVPYGTDASTLAAAGIPTVVFGPGDIAQAHTRDEWVSLEEVETASDLLYRLALLG